jgi:SAM-dependent methyltransferase
MRIKTIRHRSCSTGQRLRTADYGMTRSDIIGPGLYAGWRGSELGEITEAIEDRLLLRLLGEVAGHDVLDVGCGDGSLALELSRRGARVTGVDANPEMIERAVARAAAAGAEVTFAVGAGQRLPFPDACFDVVLAKTVLCFVADAETMIAEMARVLRPGGRFVIGELGRWSTWAAGRRLRAWFGSPLWRQGRFRTAGELEALARAAGLRRPVLRGAVFYPRWRWAARLMAPVDAWLGERLHLGAAFLALSAEKPPAP